MEDLNQKLAEIVKNKEFVNWAGKKECKFKFPVREEAGYMEEPIEALDLSVRSYNCLKRAGFTTIKSLISSIEGREDLKRIRNLGSRSADEIMLKLFLYQYLNFEESQREAYLERVREMNANKQSPASGV